MNNNEEILVKVKNLLGMGSSTAQDDVLMDLIEVVKLDMADSGVKESVIDSSNAIGTIVRGVIDNWNYGTGADYSKMYLNGVVKLREKKEETKGEENGL